MTKEGIGIVIQGPLISKGRTGRTVNIPLRNVSNDDIVEFNCIPLISELYKRYSKRYEIVCVVWSSELEVNKQEIMRNLPPDAVHIIEDDTRFFPRRSEIIPGNNKYRQIRSSLAGFELLAARGCTHLAKIRSDMLIDMDQLVQDFYVSRSRSRSRSRVLLPKLNLRAIDSIEDYYIMGESRLIIRLFQAYLDKPELFESVHFDLFYRWGRELEGVLMWPFFLRESWFYTKYIRKVWRNFIPGSRILFERLIWRGEKMQLDCKGNDIFLDDLGVLSPSEFIGSRGRQPLIRILINGALSRLRRILN